MKKKIREKATWHNCRRISSTSWNYFSYLRVVLQTDSGIVARWAKLFLKYKGKNALFIGLGRPRSSRPRSGTVFPGSIRTSRPVSNVPIFLFKTEPTHQLVSSANLQLLSPPWVNIWLPLRIPDWVADHIRKWLLLVIRVNTHYSHSQNNLISRGKDSKVNR